MAIDRSVTVFMCLKNNFPFIEMQYNLWHIAKSIKKKLKALPRSSDQQEVSVWCQAIINHMHYCAQTSDGNVEPLLKKWHYVLYHITGMHSRESDSDFKLFKSWDYDLLESLGKRKLERAYLQRSLSTSIVSGQLAKVVKDKCLCESLSDCTRNVPTDQLESCHSMMLKCVPKRLHFKFPVMVARTCLAALDHNFNAKRQLTAAQKTQWSRITGRWV